MTNTIENRPVAQPSVDTNSAANVNARDVYLAKPQQTIQDIARDTGISESRLRELNPFIDYDVQEGDVLKLTSDTNSADDANTRATTPVIPREEMIPNLSPVSDSVAHALRNSSEGTNTTASGDRSNDKLIAGRNNSAPVSVGRNTYDLGQNTFNGRKLELRGGDPRQYTGIERVVLHETTNGHLTRSNIDNAEGTLNVESDAVALKDGSLLQQSLNNRRPSQYGVADGIGTITERGGNRGKSFDVEIDYCAKDEYWEYGGVSSGLVRNKANQMTEAQYRSAAKAVADVAILKYTGLVKSGANYDPNSTKPVITVESHRYADRSVVNDRHQDPRNFDTAKFKRYVEEELRAFKMPTTLVKFEGW
jgi:hypothetical protein